MPLEDELAEFPEEERSSQLFSQQQPDFLVPLLEPTRPPARRLPKLPKSVQFAKVLWKARCNHNMPDSAVEAMARDLADIFEEHSLPRSKYLIEKLAQAPSLIHSEAITCRLCESFLDENGLCSKQGCDFSTFASPTKSRGYIWVKMVEQITLILEGWCFLFCITLVFCYICYDM